MVLERSCPGIATKKKKKKSSIVGARNFYAFRELIFNQGMWYFTSIKVLRFGMQEINLNEFSVIIYEYDNIRDQECEIVGAMPQTFSWIKSKHSVWMSSRDGKDGVFLLPSLQLD